MHQLADGISSDLIARAFATSFDALLVHDAHGRVIAANATACRRLGRSESQLAEIFLDDFGILQENLPSEVADDRLTVTKRSWQQGWSTPCSNATDRRYAPPGDRSLRMISLPRKISEAPVARPRGVINGPEPEAANESQMLFVAEMNHEIRTPLQALLGMSELLLDTRVTKRQKAYLESIRSSGEMLLKIIDDILDFSALEAASLKMFDAETEVVDIVEPVLVMLGRAAYCKGIELACQIDVQGHRVVGDPHRIRQVLANLICNAIKFTDEGEVIVDVSVEQAADGPPSVRFKVQDSGTGIDDSRKERMFAPFSTIGAKTRRRRGGTGLGLAICRHLVDLMGGSIDIETRRDVSGTIASYGLPAVCGSEEEATRPLVQDASRVLVVDDNRQVGEATCAQLTSLGFVADLATEHRDALRRLLTTASSQPYRAVMIDAETAGAAMAMHIRSKPTLDPLAIILVTSLASSLEPGFATRVSARCIDKPVVPGQLRTCMQEVLEAGPDGLGETAGSGARETIAGSRVLVVDDNPVSREVLKDMLAGLGCDVDATEDGYSALKAVAENDYQLMLLDCQLPDLEGYTVAREVGAVSLGNVPAIVAISANGNAKVRARCRHAGMQDFLMKPVTMAVLRATLERWLRPGAERLDAPQDNVAASVEETPPGTGTVDVVPENVVEMFINDGESRLARLAFSLGCVDVDARAVVRESHALKSGSLFLGQQRLAALAGQIEECARSGAIERARGVLQRLNREFDACRRHLVTPGTAKCR